MDLQNLLAPVGLLHNTSDAFWHPIIFRPAPRPSDTENDVLIRFRSSAHHTNGFAKKELALRFLGEHDNWKDTGLEWEWDGSGLPNMTYDFCPREFCIHK